MKSELAREYGISRRQVSRIVAASRKQAAPPPKPKPGDEAKAIDSAALRLRHEFALELAPAASELERFDLFAAVIGPSRLLAEASRLAPIKRLGALSTLDPPK